MLRSLFALLVLALPLVAAPVPKAVKKQTAPSVAGGVWSGTNDGAGDLDQAFEYTFHEGGEFTASSNGRQYSKGTWKQDGDTVEWEFNNRYAVYTVTFKDATFEGKAVNVKGKSWQVTLKPAAK